MSEQFVVYIREMLSFRFGLSTMTGQPVWDELKNRVPNTVALLLPALLLSAALGIFLGVKAALRRGSAVERTSTSTRFAAALSRVATSACGSMSTPTTCAAPSRAAAIARIPDPQP